MPHAQLTQACAHDCLAALRALYESARTAVRARVCSDDVVNAERLERYQLESHALAMMATELEAANHLLTWAARVRGELEYSLAIAALASVANHFRGEIVLGQCERVSLTRLGVSDTALRAFECDKSVDTCRVEGSHTEYFRRIVALIQERDGRAGQFGLADNRLESLQASFSTYSDQRIAPLAQTMHLSDGLIPIALIQEMASRGVFGLTIPRRFNGAGLGKMAMCVVTEELSRACLAAGSLGTRVEIAAELILLHGTEHQRGELLPKLTTCDVIPAVAFTEPGHGSDLAHVETKASRSGDVYLLSGQKTWITHAARANLLVVLARTTPGDQGYGGLSIFLAARPRGTEATPFPDKRLTGEAIPAIGYRGLKQYRLAFHDFEVPTTGLLGGVEGRGFKQLMQTMESARIQTAARAIGVAQSAFDLSFGYASARRQFGKLIIEFPRIYHKLAYMAVWIMASRQLTYAAARKKDGHQRCDLEAAMAKLLAAKVGWECADAGLQIHGGDGFAQQAPISRVLADARVLPIFEGTAEIQADIIARRILAG